MSTPVTIQATGKTDSTGACTITFQAPPLDTVYIGSVSVTNSDTAINWLVTVGGTAVGKSFGGGAFGPVNILQAQQLVLSATSLTVGTSYSATFTGTADSSQDADYSYPQPQVPSIDISGTGINVNVTGGTIDIGNDPNVNIFSFQNAELDNFLISAGVNGNRTVIVPSWVGSIWLLVKTSGGFFAAFSVTGTTTNINYLNAPLVNLTGGFVPLTVITMVPGIDGAVSIVWTSPSNNADVWVIGSSQLGLPNTETFQVYTDFTNTAPGPGTALVLPAPDAGKVWEIAKTMANAPTTAAATNALYFADSGGIVVDLGYQQANGTVIKSESHFYWGDSLTLHNVTSVAANGLVLAREVPESGGIL